MAQIDQTPKEFLVNLSPQDFKKFGIQQLAYMRPIESQAGEAWGIFAADGTCLEMTEDRAVAVAHARSKALFPMTVH